MSLNDEDNNFVVDENDNPVNYGEDESDDEEQSKEAIFNSGELPKYLNNMANAKIKKRNAQNGVPENIVKIKKEKIDNLIDELDDDDEDDNDYNNKYKPNYNYQNANIHAKPYMPQYNENINNNFFQNKNIDIDMNNNNINNNYIEDNEDIIMKSPEDEIQKQTNETNNNKIQGRKKIKSSNNNNIISLNSEITPLKRMNNFGRTHSEIKTTQLLETPINSNNETKQTNLSSYSKINNEISPNLLSSGVQLRNTNTKKLPTEKDESVLIYWYEAFEEIIHRKPIIIFFGKIYDPSENKFVSISLVIKNIEKTVFIIPKPEYDSQDKLKDVYDEFELMRKANFSFIQQYKVKYCEKNYCFELPINRDIPHNFLKIKYSAEYGKLPHNLQGKTFDYIFGKDASLLENIILNRKIYGPCWLKVKNFEYGKSMGLTLSNFEIVINDYKNIEVLPDEIQKNKIIPPFKILSLSTKSIQVNNSNELFCIACTLIDNFHIEDEKGHNDINKFQPLIFFRKIDNTLPIFKDRLNSPFNSIGIKEIDIKIFGGNVLNAGNETALISQFLNKVYQFDPDIIVGHNLYNNHIENILSRINKLKIHNWSRISRYKREVLPRYLQNVNLSNEYIRCCLIGRLICDTFSSTREILSRETSYDLDYLCEKYLNKLIPDIDVSQVISSFNKIADIERILQITLDEAFYSLVLMNKFQILPLTKQLTTISGNLWIRSLQSSRANRCEFLLLHKFYENNYIYPDKENRSFNEDKYNDEDNDSDNENDNKIKTKSRNLRRKPQYSGGLVLEPHPGLYDKIVLVMDFNSLYPSIIQEYNISFETVIRPATQSFIFDNFKKDKNNKKNKGKNKKDKNEKNKDNNNKEEKSDDDDNFKEEEFTENEDEHVEINDKVKKMKKAILPLILEGLVRDRNIIKKIQKNEKDPFKNSLLEIKQKALKVSANSLYGFLGYKNSRFFCKEIAALVTSTGRRILKNAALIVEKKHDYNIIYGDTDSVIINTMTESVLKALEIGNTLRKSISNQYKLLVMDIDGLFKSMLLLKKKKYACLKYIEPYNENSPVKIEMKGVDIVRRDWCPISKETGNIILNCILSGLPKEEIISNIFEEMKKVSQLLDEKKIPLKDYIITKQLAKNIDDYNDLKALPHVRVAKRLKEKGDRTIKVNSYIPYIVCLPKDNNNNRNMKSIAERSYHPKEIEEDNSLEIDVNWYKENQILSVVKRLVQHIDEISTNQLCECLGIENKHYVMNINENYNNNYNNIQEEIFDLRLKEGLNIICDKCKKNYSVKEMTSRNICINLIMKCPFCGEFIKNENKITNTILNQLKRDIFLYYRRKQLCRKCREESSCLFLREKCADQSCKGIMMYEYNEYDIANEINFLYKLTNVESNKKSQILEFEKGVEKVKDVIKDIYDKMGYNTLDFQELFNFLNI